MLPAFNDADHIFRSPKFVSVVEDALAFFAQTPLHPLPPTEKFIGPGVYALYYQGDFPDYAPLVRQNAEQVRLPIYIGKAVPQGCRTGRVSDADRDDLHGRLREHAKSVGEAQNLNPADFVCHFMILKGVETDLIVPVEAALIRFYRPLWNQTVAGFGLHDVGTQRYNQIRAQWDTLHPGRKWTSKITGATPNIAEIQAAIGHALAHLPGDSTSP